MGHLRAISGAASVRVAQLVRLRQAEAVERERIEQEMRVVRLIQQTLLPKALPSLPGWRTALYYQPARTVGGDFYDFIQLTDGCLGITIGDVTDKGVPSALEMASTRSLLRSLGRQGAPPAEVVQQVNELLQPELPQGMFVTCFYAVLNPATGTVRYPNAGHLYLIIRAMPKSRSRAPPACR